MAGCQPEGHRVLRSRSTRADPLDVDVGGVRLHPPPSRQGRRRRDVAQPDRGEHLGGVHRRQELRVPGGRGVADDPRRGRRDDRRLGRVPHRSGPDGARRPRTLLRRVQGQPRVLPASDRGRGRQRRQPSRALRHQRRHPAERGPSDRRRRQGSRGRRRGDRDPLPRRHGLRRRELDGCGRGRCRPRAGHAQRARRAHRQHQPHHRHPEPAAQARVHLSAGRSHRAVDRRQPPRCGDPQPRRQPAGSVRRIVGVRPQGRSARVGDRPRQGRLRTRESGTRRQRDSVSSCRRWRVGRRSR